MRAHIIENPAWHNTEGIYADRQEAGRIVASLLEPYATENAIVLAIPSGGIPVGLEIAGRLHIDFDMIIIRKIPIPGNTEAGFGALSIEGDMVLNQPLIKQLGLSKQKIDQLIKPVAKQIEERTRLFRSKKPFPVLTDRTVILTDDGLASGYTMSVAAEVVRRKKPKQIIIATPTAPMSTIDRLREAVDVIICPNIRQGFYFAVASAYRKWHDLDNAEVLSLLQCRM
jgi:putative phosphoribosyl transferase